MHSLADELTNVECFTLGSLDKLLYISELRCLAYSLETTPHGHLTVTNLEAKV